MNGCMKAEGSIMDCIRKSWFGGVRRARRENGSGVLGFGFGFGGWKACTRW